MASHVPRKSFFENIVSSDVGVYQCAEFFIRPLGMVVIHLVSVSTLLVAWLLRSKKQQPPSLFHLTTQANFSTTTSVAWLTLRVDPSAKTVLELLRVLACDGFLFVGFFGSGVVLKHDSHRWFDCFWGALLEMDLNLKDRQCLWMLNGLCD